MTQFFGSELRGIVVRYLLDLALTFKNTLFNKNKQNQFHTSHIFEIHKIRLKPSQMVISTIQTLANPRRSHSNS